MLTLDAVRSAVLSDQPWNRLDELVRAEQDAGRKVKEIYADLMGMADEIDATPGLSEDGSDAFGDTLDALTGYCHRDCQYKDPPNATLPSEEEIAVLPRWAQVAFAARCARRVLPLFALYHWPHPGAVNLHVLRLGVGSAERGDTWEALTAHQNAIGMMHDAAMATAQKHHTPAIWSASAARTLYEAIQSRLATNQDEIRYAVFETTRAAESASGSFELQSVIRRDFDHLAALAEWQHWTDDTPVPPEVFGPLWPEGPPKGWPPATDVPQRTELAIEAFARDRATEQMIEDDIVNLFNALNRYHIARSGVRLTLEQFRSLLPALVPAEV